MVPLGDEIGPPVAIPRDDSPPPHGRRKGAPARESPPVLGCLTPRMRRSPSAFPVLALQGKKGLAVLLLESDERLASGSFLPAPAETPGQLKHKETCKDDELLAAEGHRASFPALVLQPHLSFASLVVCASRAGLVASSPS